MKRVSIAFIIHTFAILHAAAALSCRFAGIEDELFLTILTMAMVLLLCIKRKLNIEFSAASIIVANLIGFLMGNYGASLLDKLISSPYLVNAVSTAVTTEVLGWSVVVLTKIFRLDRNNNDGGTEDSFMKWALIAIAMVFFIRLCIVLIFSDNSFGMIDMVNAVIKVFSNSIALVTILCVNIVYIRFGEKFTKSLTQLAKAIILTVFFLAVSLLETLLISETASVEATEFWKAFPALFLTSLLAQTTVYCVVFMANYALSAKSKMKAEIGKANLAQYRYMKLKNQVNPHFLFNSLNILDCLVCDEKNEKASLYIHKLAGIYRYMIKSEDEDLVPLRDEMEFVKQYIDLLLIRFPEGFNVEVNLPEDLMGRYVAPCAIQLLIENATKHNAINTADPLIIKLEADRSKVWVSNNIVPKFGKVESTGLGLKYLRQQYLDLSGQSIAIEKSEAEFKVTLPLI